MIAKNEKRMQLRQVVKCIWDRTGKIVLGKLNVSDSEWGNGTGTGNTMPITLCTHGPQPSIVFFPVVAVRRLVKSNERLSFLGRNGPPCRSGRRWLVR